jgi:mannose-6-phosphate isomerase class I
MVWGEQTYSSYLIVQEEFKFERTHLRAERSELDHNVYKVLLFLEDEACVKEKHTRWPFRRGLIIASPVIQVVRTSSVTASGLTMR